MPELVFKGKEYVYNHHLTVPYRPLVADATKSISAPDLGGNLIIHGDNLHALKALLPRYAGKVDLVFIDPPYNTGNEGWCYNDNVNSPMMKEWLSNNPVGIEDMLRHDKWLAMMWPRLTLLSQLLSDTGTLVICIDDNEAHNLIGMTCEIFGEASFVGSVCWKTRNTDNRVKTNLSIDHEYALLFTRGTSFQGRVIDRSAFANPDNDPRGPYVTDPVTGKATAIQRPNLHYVVTNPATGDQYPPDQAHGWVTDRAGFQALIDEKKIWWPPNPKTGKPRKKRFLSETKERMPESSFWTDIKYQAGAEIVDRILGTHIFDFPKPLDLVEKLIDLCSRNDSLVLDSFAGSGTTAHAVLKANAKDKGTRRFILVEGEDYADRLTAERVRRVINGYAWVGTQRETLLEEKLTWTQLKKADALIEKVNAIQAREGFAENDGQMALGDSVKKKAVKRRFDKLNVKVDDGVLRVEGEKRISERVEGLGGSFTYCTLGEPLDVEKLLSGEHLPDFDALGAWLFHTATGGALPKRPKSAPAFYLGEALDKHAWLIYQPNLAFLKSPDSALTLTRAKEIAAWGRSDPNGRKEAKGHLVFAPAKYMSHKQLLEHGIEFAQLPFALYREA